MGNTGNGQVRFETVDYQNHEAVLRTVAGVIPVLEGSVTYLQVYTTPKVIYVIAGSVEGSLGVWDA